MTAKRRQNNLHERYCDREVVADQKGKRLHGKDHIRAELSRLARAIKQLERVSPKDAPVTGCDCQICSMRKNATGAYINRQDVLDLIKEAKR